jgi:aryl-alcohol dehydrogenase-like predicted oxidoreductase
MELRSLGKSHLKVSAIGLGLAAIGRPAYINLGREEDLPPGRTLDEMQARSHELLDEAFRLGVRYFDAARSYGVAEQFLGSWLHQRDPLPEPVTCGSKWGYAYVGDWRMDASVHEVKDHSLTMLRRQYRESSELLGKHLQLYEVHSATLESGVLENHEVLSELLRLSRGGLAIGLSVSGPRQAEVIHRALAVEVDGLNPFSVVQATWNLLETSAGAALDEAHRAGWGVLVKEGLANGRLLVAGKPRLEPLLRAATDHGVGADAVALAVILAQSWTDVVLSGAVTVAQLRSNAGAAALAISTEEQAMLSRLAQSAPEYWSERQGLPWS